jgi:ABC-type arginine/histidine transport system permease subunit
MNLFFLFLNYYGLYSFSINRDIDFILFFVSKYRLGCTFLLLTLEVLNQLWMMVFHLMLMIRDQRTTR